MKVDWDVCERCAEDGGIGVRLPSGGKCWAHADDQDLDAALKRLGEDGHLEARGVPITQELLGRLLAAAPRDDHGHAILTDARFDGAAFHGTAQFHEARFQRDAVFDGATFHGFAILSGAAFQGEAGFEGATFRRDAWFSGAAFHGAARFGVARGKVTFQGDAWFNRATFQGYAWFLWAAFHGDAQFDEARFERDAWFSGATFHGAARFDRATFEGDARFDVAGDRTTFQGDARFSEATFRQARQLGPMLVCKNLWLDQAVFHQPAQLEVAAAAVFCQQTRFLAGVQLRVHGAQVMLEEAELAAPSILTSAPAFHDLEEGRTGQPRLVSVRRADVAGLTVAGVDLRACRFVGAHHLDQLRIEESAFAPTPKSWRWTTRQTIAEEHHWRATDPLAPASTGNRADEEPPPITASRGAGRRRGWHQPVHRTPAWLAVEPPSPAQLAALYRALRKAREDAKDEPGAADFYYGEMEMRRHDPTKPRAERLVLLLYWLLSGYGLRASRALAWLLGVLIVATVVLAAAGLEQMAAASFPARLGTAVLIAVEGAVFRASEQELTYTGRLVQAVLRFVGPVLLGLAVLSIRGRVKR